MAKGIIYRSLDTRIYKMWTSKAFTQREIAEKVGVHYNTVANAIRRELQKANALDAM